MSCPTCRKAAKKDGNPAFPFCCERCRLVDLGRWVNEEYRIPEGTDGSAAEVIPDPDAGRDR